MTWLLKLHPKMDKLKKKDEKKQEKSRALLGINVGHYVKLYYLFIYQLLKHHQEVHEHSYWLNQWVNRIYWFSQWQSRECFYPLTAEWWCVCGRMCIIIITVSKTRRQSTSYLIQYTDEMQWSWNWAAIRQHMLLNIVIILYKYTRQRERERGAL